MTPHAQRVSTFTAHRDHGYGMYNCVDCRINLCYCCVFTTKPERDRGGRGAGGPCPPPPPPSLPIWMVKSIYYYYFLFYLSISITYRKNLPYIWLIILRFFPTNPPISDSLSLVLLLNGRLDFNSEIMEFQLLFLFSFIFGSVFHELKIKFQFLQKRHSFMKATYRRYA